MPCRGGRSRLGRWLGLGLTYADAKRSHMAEETIEGAELALTAGPTLRALMERNTLDAAQLPLMRSILAAVGAKLNTPRGLRSLDPAHPDYHGIYTGDRRARDAAYHQGTVWGWLHGPYMDALLRFAGEAGRAEARTLLEGWAGHLGEACLGQASEVFDGDAPHRPRGCCAQAWTVAELLRIARRLGDQSAATGETRSGAGATSS